MWWALTFSWNCKGGLISESLSLWLTKNGCQISLLTTILLKRKCSGERFGIRFWRCQQKWKTFFEIKPPLGVGKCICDFTKVLAPLGSRLKKSRQTFACYEEYEQLFMHVIWTHCLEHIGLSKTPWIRNDPEWFIFNMQVLASLLQKFSTIPKDGYE